MRKRLIATVLCTLLVAGCTHRAAFSEFVSLSSPAGARMAGVQPMPLPYTQRGPTATAWMPNGDAHLADGRVVSGMMIRAWSESGAARVQVYAMVTKEGTVAQFTTNEAELEPLEIGSYLLRHNDSVAISEMAIFGVEPMLLRY